MNLSIAAPELAKIEASIRITGSKSETNRLLLLQALYPNLKIENISNSDDAQVMQKGLLVTNGIADIHHAGTAMRFLTSFFATQEGREVVLTGSHRMKERPIGILVDALNSLGASISYVENEGFPPLKITGKKIAKNKVSLPANISSQYISSLCLVAAGLENGLEIELVGKVTSVPYIKMTLALLQEVGIASTFEGNIIKILSKKSVEDKVLVVESDWSAASYYYSVAALAEIGSTIKLSAYKESSLQGDSVLADIYKSLGVKTAFKNNTITLTKVEDAKTTDLKLDLANAPDIAQTIAVTCFGLGIACHLRGLHTLPIKETDRLAAMKTELEKFGAQVIIDHESLQLVANSSFKKNIAVDTYHDHRMAMAFAPLALKVPFVINDAGVVSKSYPDFWSDFKILGYKIEEA
ncbi:3-phosphoshikimate 1-carboxyvinyltransferase [Croceivirga lutea]|uniref:3-phosphoshikimate 1-carboxyvinyltransferase n=1 Tax=Croceivirga lutea TaxID=1775167 RepID=UPI00163B1779|nr:3-phosphoshikimate 1-carboxyvinyltransferase [Croceivirga lutea]GGG53417.1 3-phosphoshikimate 1-carboxyvinyltransferase [Croceivirga lutea]